MKSIQKGPNYRTIISILREKIDNVTPFHESDIEFPIPISRTNGGFCQMIDTKIEVHTFFFHVIMDGIKSATLSKFFTQKTHSVDVVA